LAYVAEVSLTGLLRSAFTRTAVGLWTVFAAPFLLIPCDVAAVGGCLWASGPEKSIMESPRGTELAATRSSWTA